VREPVLTVAASAGKIQQQGPDDYYFGLPQVEVEPEDDGELLLTEIAEPLVDSFDGRSGPVVAEDEATPRLNGIPRELRVADVERLVTHPSLNGNLRGGGDPYRSTNRHNVPRELRAEESSQFAGNSGTLEPSQRSWWRRAFRRGN